MFEFHGWVTVRASALAEYYDRGDDDVVVGHVRRLVAEDASGAGPGALVEVRAMNGQWHVLLHGLRNHRQGWVVELFRRIGAVAPGSYGILHVHDDEAEDDSRWVCWAMRRGLIVESTEERLTPHFGLLEVLPPYYD